MAGRRLDYEINVDSSGGIKGVERFGKAVRKEMRAVEQDLEDTRTAGAKVADVLSSMAGTIETELRGAATAADALSTALGPELAARADVGSIVGDLNRMGLTFEEITADADRLAGSIRQLDQVQTAGLERGLGGVSTSLGRLDEKARSAGSSSSVLANAVGNAGQDVAALGGIAGTAGVAIGQMGEYMADALADGDKLTTVLRNFGAVAGPIAALVVAMEAVAAVQARFAESAGRTESNVEAVTDALTEGGDAAQNYAESLEETGQVIVDNVRAQSKLENVIGELNSDWKTAGVGVQLLAHWLGVAKEETEDITPLLAKAGLTADQWSRLISGSAGSLDEFETMLAGTTLSVKEQEAVMRGARQATEDWAEGVENAAVAQAFFGDEVDETAEATERWLKATKPISDMPRTWQAVTNAVKRYRAGLEPTARQEAAIAVAMREYGLTREQVLTRGAELWEAEGDAAEDAANAQVEAVEQMLAGLKDWAEAQQAAIDEADNWALALLDAQAALDEMGTSFATMERREGAIAAAFELGNVAIDALAQTQDVNDAIRDLAQFIHDEGVPNVFDPNDVDAGPFLAKIQSLRGPIQTAVSEAFAAGGPAAATATADRYVQQIVESLDGALTADQVREMLGLGDLQAVLHIAVDQSDLKAAQDELAVLVGLTGENAFTATVGLAVASGALSPQAARVLIQRELERHGVVVPATMETPDTGPAVDEAEQFMARHPAAMATAMETGAPDNTSAVLSETQGYLNRRPVAIRTYVAPPDTRAIAQWFGSFMGRFDAGGVARNGGIAGEGSGPEILNGRWLTTGPTYVPPGTRVTSTARTRTILSRRLPRYGNGTSGGVVPFNVQPINVNVNAAVVGNRFDVMRAVRRANLDDQRLRGTRGQ